MPASLLFQIYQICLITLCSSCAALGTGGDTFLRTTQGVTHGVGGPGRFKMFGPSMPLNAVKVGSGEGLTGWSDAKADFDCVLL